MAISESGSPYFIRVRGRILGPYSVDQLKTLRLRGQFSRANEVSTDRQAWQSAASIEHLFANPSKAIRSQAHLRQESDQEIHEPEAKAPARKGASGWYYAIGADQFGPVSLVELQSAFSESKLTAKDLVWRDGLAEWTAAGELGELRFLTDMQRSLPDREQVLKSATHGDDANERQLLVDTYALASNLRRAGLTGIFPFRVWLHDRPLTLVWVQLLVFLFGFPLLLGQYYVNRDAPLVEAAWALSLYFAIIGAAVLYRCVRPESIGIPLICGVWLFTGLVGVAVVLLLSGLGTFLPFTHDAFEATKSANIFVRLVGFTLAVGFVEEFVKALPPLLVAGFSSKPMTPNTGAFLGCVSGLAFGSTEAVLYSIQYAIGHSVSALPSYGDYILVQILRFVSLPLLHGIWSGIAGYFIVLAKSSPGSRGSMIVLGLVLVSFLHGVYDTLVSDQSLGWAGASVAMMSLFLFIGYIRADASVANMTSA